MFLLSLLALLLLAILATALVLRSYQRSTQWGAVTLALLLLLYFSTRAVLQHHEDDLLQAVEQGKHAGDSEQQHKLDALKRQLLDYRTRLVAIQQALADE